MKIQIWDYQKEYEEHRDEILASIDEVFRSGQLILGESVKEFEKEINRKDYDEKLFHKRLQFGKFGEWI